MTQPNLTEMVARLPNGVVRALTEDGAPIPDSLWFGKWAHLREHVPGSTINWRWSKLGLAVREHLRAGLAASGE